MRGGVFDTHFRFTLTITNRGTTDFSGLVEITPDKNSKYLGTKSEKIPQLKPESGWTKKIELPRIMPDHLVTCDCFGKPQNITITIYNEEGTQQGEADTISLLCGK